MKSSPRRIHRRFNPAERQRLVDLYHKSNLTQREFAREQDLKLSTFQQWRYRPKKLLPAAPPHFQEMLLGAPTTLWPAEVSLAPGVTIRLGNSATPELIGRLMQSLRQIC